MNWKTKAFVQKTISFLPFSYRINYFLQRYMTVGKNLPETFILDRLQQAVRHLDSHKSWGEKTIDSIKILEIGTGWYPIVPIALFLSGANEIVSFDIRKLYSRMSIDQTLRSFLALHKCRKLVDLLPHFIESRMLQVDKALKESQVSKKWQYLSIEPKQLENGLFPFSSSCFDVVVSNNTFQFVPKENLTSWMTEIHRISKKNSIFSLSIDLTDEFSHSDPHIGPFHFLKYSERRWKFITCPLNATSRLRFSDFQHALQAQFDLVNSEKTVGELHLLEKKQVHPQFATYEWDDLLVKEAYFVAQPKTDAQP